jgi:dipeptidase
MRNKVFLILLITTTNISTFPCTNYIVTKGASKDGSAFLAYTNDGEDVYILNRKPAENHKAGEMLELFSSRNNVRGKIKQVSHTYAVIGFHMNEYQLALGETTFGGRDELWNHSKFLEYWIMMEIVLERAKTAREAIKVFTDLCDEYGYGSEGESISIVDPNEAWLLEIVGTGTNGGNGANWVAMKIPDGFVCGHANMSRIGEFPLNDPDNCMYSKTVISFAIEKGYYDPKSGEPFRFNAAYCPAYPEGLRYCETRVWSLFRRSAPSMNLSPDYCRGVKGAKPYPLWLKPDSKLDLKDVMSMIRDHYEGTDFDMTKGIAAGPFGNPNVQGPLSWECNNNKYGWERPISVPFTGFTLIAQLRSWLPDAVGGILWFGMNDSYFTCYEPLYCCLDRIPKPFTVGDIKKFTWNSSWWVFKFVSNFANLKYSYMIKDIQDVQSELENKFIEHDAELTKPGSDFLKKTKKKEIKYLSDYSYRQGDYVLKRWIELSEALITKYNDGFVQDEKGNARGVEYPIEFKQHVVKTEPDKHKISVW